MSAVVVVTVQYWVEHWLNLLLLKGTRRSRLFLLLVPLAQRRGVGSLNVLHEVAHEVLPKSIKRAASKTFLTHVDRVLLMFGIFEHVKRVVE